jgi:Fe-S-cluster containining protein
MKLDVLSTATEPWFADGLTFTCTQCGNCCTGAPGYVFASKVEITRLAEHLEISPEEVVERYCRKVGTRISFKEKRGPGGYDCIFLEEVKATRRVNGQEIAFTRRQCSIYPVRPLQCRTWPFWDGNLASREAWDAAAKGCHGMNHGSRRFTARKIEQLRDADDWPDNPPTSKAR